MIKRICFFSTGFAFNRLVRMRYYEKIFPKDTEIFLYTTSKYTSKEECKKQWDLNRTNVFVEDYNLLKTPFKLRKFCNKNKITRLVNLGHPGAGFPFLIASLLQKRDYLMGFYGEVFKHKHSKTKWQAIKKFIQLFQFWFVAFFAKKLVFTDLTCYQKAPTFFLTSKKRVNFAAAPVNTSLFVPNNKNLCRKKLKLPLNKHIVIRVGRVNYGKCCDIYLDLVKSNPDILFILIGEWFENEIPKVNYKNLLYLEKKSSKELVDYYSASDLSFALHRHGNGIGIVAEEALSCGVPTILPTTLTMPKSNALILVNHSSKEVNTKLKMFFSLSKTEQQKISKEARNYAEKYCSDEVWEKEFVKFHLD